MPTYERWKYCGHVNEDGTVCGAIAGAECSCGGIHLGEKSVEGFPEADVDHPRFVCSEHKSLYD